MTRAIVQLVVGICALLSFLFLALVFQQSVIYIPRYTGEDSFQREATITAKQQISEDYFITFEYTHRGETVISAREQVDKQLFSELKIGEQIDISGNNADPDNPILTTRLENIRSARPIVILAGILLLLIAVFINHLANKKLENGLFNQRSSVV